MLATGKSYPNEEKVEIIDLFDPQWKYEFLNPRLARYGAVGNLVQNKSLICGGIRTMSNKKYLQNGLGKGAYFYYVDRQGGRGGQKNAYFTK